MYTFSPAMAMGRPASAVRVLIQDHTDILDASQRPAPRFTDIAIDKIIRIDQDDVSLWRRLLRKMLRKNGGSMAVVGALLLAQQIGGLPSTEHAQMPLFVGAITSALATSFKGELGTGTHNFTVSSGDVVKTALFTSTATLGASTTAYATTNEITGTGYSAGGVTMANVTPTTSGTTAIFDWADAVWTSASFTANGCLAYNSSKSNKALFVIAFGSDQTVTSGTFTIQWPTADASNAIIRL